MKQKKMLLISLLLVSVLLIAGIARTSFQAEDKQQNKEMLHSIDYSLDSSDTSAQTMIGFSEDPSAGPTVEIKNPGDGTTVFGTVNISGISSDSQDSIVLVECKIDNGPWISANGINEWYLYQDLVDLEDKELSISARAKNESGSYSDIDTITVNLNNMEISKIDHYSDECNPYKVKDVISYNISFTNDHSSSFDQLCIRDYYEDASLSFKNPFPFTNDDEHYDYGDYVQVNITLDDELESGESDSVQLDYEVVSALGEEINFHAVLYDLENDMIIGKDSCKTQLGEKEFQNLSIQKVDNQEGQVPQGGTINYTITVNNPHPFTVEDVYVFDILPEQAVLNPETENDPFYISYYNPYNSYPSNWWYNGRNIVKYKIPHMNPGETINLFLVIDLKSDCPTCHVNDSVLNTAEVRYYDMCSNYTPNKPPLNIDHECYINTTTCETMIIVYDDTPPETNLFVGEPNITENDTTHSVTTFTDITLKSQDPGSQSQGVEFLHYKIEIWNESIDAWEQIENVTVGDNDINDTNPNEDFVDTTFSFNEECYHKLIYWAEDIKNVENKSHHYFIVDETPPGLNESIGSPYDPCLIKYGDTWFGGITPQTTINISSEGDNGCQGGSGLGFIKIVVYHGCNYGEWDSIDEYKIHDGDEEDAITEEGKIGFEFQMDESCWHEIEYFVEDVLGNRNPAQNTVVPIDLIVDADGPVSNDWYEGGIQYHDAYHWITTDTKKWVHTEDVGCIDGGSGVSHVDWWIDIKTTNGNWQTVKSGTVHDDSIFDTDCDQPQPQTGESGGLYAFDEIGEAYTFKDFNQNWTYDEYDNYTVSVNGQEKSKDELLNLDADGNGVNAIPSYGDSGGLFVSDKFGDPVFFKDLNGNGAYDYDHVNYEEATYHPYYDGCPDMIQTLDGKQGGYLAFDSISGEPYTFKDNPDTTNDEWTYDYDGPGNNTDDDIIEWNPYHDGVLGEITFNMTVDENCEHNFYYQSEDNMGNKGSIHKQTVRVDTTAPVSNLFIGSPQHDDCIRTNTPITITSQDNGQSCNVGLDYFVYEVYNETDLILQETVNDLNQVTFTLPDSGLYTIKYYGVDLLGNTESVHERILCVDDVPPVLSTQIIGKNLSRPHETQPDYWITSETLVLIDAHTQGCCDCLSLKYRFNQNEWITITDYLPYPLDFPNQCKYTLELYAEDCLGNSVMESYQFYVDETPPDFYIEKPKNHYYRDGGSIQSTIYASDSSNLVEPCFDNHKVGIDPGSLGDAWLVDINPVFTYVALNNSEFMYDDTEQCYTGSLGIPENSGLTEGEVLFVGGAQDALGNGAGEVIDEIIACAQDYGCNSDEFTNLILDLEQQKKLVSVMLDKTTPQVSITQPTPGVLIGPEQVFVHASISDSLSGITNGATCYWKLNGDDIGTLPYDESLSQCEGMLSIPSMYQGLNDVTLSVSVFDNAGNEGTDSVVVDIELEDEIGPTVTITRPDNGDSIGPDELTITVQATDDDSGVNTAAGCNITLDGILIGTLPFNGCVFEGTLTIPNSVIGTVSLIAEVSDLLDNKGSDSIMVIISEEEPPEEDITTPTITISTPVTDEVIGPGSFYVEATITDDESGIADGAEVTVTLDGIQLDSLYYNELNGTASDIVNIPTSLENLPGLSCYNLVLTVSDIAGNSDSAIISVCIDNDEQEYSMYDVNQDGTVNFQDAGIVWTHRTSLSSYNESYDMNDDGLVNFQDAGLVWVNRD